VPKQLEKVWSGGDSGSRFLGLVSGVSIVFYFRFSEVRWLFLSFPFLFLLFAHVALCI
jgi:hypothetical protein